MIKHKGFDEIIQKVYDNKQEHIFRYWDEISEDEKERLLNDISTVDFDLLSRLFAQSSEGVSGKLGF